MISIKIVLLFIAGVFCENLSAKNSGENVIKSTKEDLLEAWKLIYDKSYDSAAEEINRFNKFVKNVDKVTTFINRRINIPTLKFIWGFRKCMLPCFYNSRNGLYWCSVFYTSKNLNCIGALSFFYDSKRSIGEVLFFNQFYWSEFWSGKWNAWKNLEWFSAEQKRKAERKESGFCSYRCVWESEK